MAAPDRAAAEGSNRTVAMQLAAAFARHGVEVTFGQSIPTAFHLAAPEHGIRQIVYRAENAGGAMADGYARISGKVAVVTAQNGPAAALLVAPLAEALKASIPLVALVLDVARSIADRNAFQELDHVRLFDACAKWVRRVPLASRIEDYVDMAFTAAASGRPGPAVLLVPADLFNEIATRSGRRHASLGHYPLDRSVPDPGHVERAADLLAQAERPLIVAGGGVHSSHATDALARLQEEFHLPVATTVMGKGSVDETHPLSLGVIGYFMGDGSRTQDLRPTIENADVVLLIGNRTNQNGTDSWKLLPRTAKFIHIDIDGLEIGRNYEALRLVGDAKLAIEVLCRCLAVRDLAKRQARRSAVEAEIAAALSEHRRLIARISTSDAAPVRPERLMHDIDSLLDARCIVVADASYASIWIANYLTSRRAGNRFIAPRGLAGLGWGLPLAIGAQIAAPDHKVICVTGDGGFAHCWAEIETAVRLKLGIVTIVLNNQILGYQKDAEDVVFGKHTEAVYFEPVDHANIAKSCGASGVRVSDPRYFLPALRDGLDREGPTVIDVLIDPTARPPLTFYQGKFPNPFA
jgi:acetolactate synthase-1/2/3 large subunit